LTCLTADYVRHDGTGRSHPLNRALEGGTEVRLHYATQPIALYDGFLLCSSADNWTALVLDVVAPPTVGSADITLQWRSCR